MDPTPKEKASEVINNLPADANYTEVMEALNQNLVWNSSVPSWFFFISAVFAVCTFIYFCITNFDKRGKLKHSKNEKIRLIDFVLYAIWAVGPPTYFLIEYIHYFPYKLDSDQLGDLKYTQELSTKIWAAYLVIIGALLYSKNNSGK